MRRALALFLLLQGFYAATSTGRVHVSDEAQALLVARAVVEEGAFVVPEATPGFEFYGRRDREGRPRAAIGIGQAAAVAPFYAAAKALAAAPGVPPEAADLVISFGAVLSSATFAALAAALFLRLLERTGIQPRRALAAALALALGTPLFSYSGWLFSEPLAAALLVGAALVAFGSGARSGEPIAAGRAAAAGALLALAVLVRPAHAIAALVFGAAILARDGRRGVAAFLALGSASAAGAAAVLAWNTWLFGDPLTFAYPETAEGGRRLNEFSTPLLRGLFGFLASPGKSIFIFAPVAAVAAAGIPRLWRRDRALAVLAAGVPLAYLLFYARYAQWEGGYCFGPRYLVPAIPLLLLALPARLEGASPAGRAAVMALVIAGACVQAIGLATSFLEDQRHGGYYDSGFEYRLEHSPLRSQGALFIRYLGGAIAGEPPPPLGKGLDRWFIFLARAGVSPGALAVFLGAALAMAGAGALALARAVPGATSPVPATREGARSSP